MSGSRQSEARCFNENSPRPPVPGEETGNHVSRFRPQSPTLTPRRSSLATGTACNASSAPLGFEPEGSCGTTTMESDSPPAYLRWARDLHTLLEDPVGLELFRKYLEQEGMSHTNTLNFWFACEGLKEQEDPGRIHHLVKLIYRKFFLKSQLAIPEDLRKEANRRWVRDVFSVYTVPQGAAYCDGYTAQLVRFVSEHSAVKRRVKEGRVDEKVFDAVQAAVGQLINETTYPNFLRSDMYLQYVQSCQNPDSGGCPSSGSSREMSVSCGPSFLPTVHEDSEFVSSVYSSHSASDTPAELRGEIRLTKDVLIATQQTRALDLRPKPEAYAGIYLQHGASPYHILVPRAHAQYSSYNPVSRQDSELQSLSSDAQTESDSLSLIDASADGLSMGRQWSRKQFARQCRAIKESASLNRDPMAHHSIIPRTQRVPRDIIHPLKPEEFAHVLIEKLENVRRERETQDKLDRHLQENVTVELLQEAPCSGAPKGLADALREKLLIEEDSDQAILDQHVSRVWSDLTPSRSPGLASPRLHSPDRRRAAHNYPRVHKQRKEKDVFSTFSVDSGNIHDFQEGSELVGAGSMSSLGSHMPKSKSVPSDYADSLHKQDLYLQGHDHRFRRSDMSRRSATKKSMTELTDSGVSVVSDAPPSTISKDIRLLSWLKETDKKTDAKHGRHSKKYGSRSGSLERTTRENWGVPAQPFVGDPGMPPLPQPHTATQLEEARRRLIEEDRTRANKQRHSSISKQTYEPIPQSQSYVQSNQSTLRKTRQDAGDFTTVVFSFCDEQFPYRTKIPGHNVTLKQFKEYLPKKGSYRYFFKTECEDLDTKVIQEEITDDSEVLPLWEGKVMAQVKAME